MRIVGRYSFKGGREVLADRYDALLKEVEQVIESVDSSLFKTKESKEKTMMGQMLYSPSEINGAFKASFSAIGWHPVRVRCDYPLHHYVEGYDAKSLNKGAFREMDFVKERLGVEVQFGKYAFMVYNVCAKMTIFKNLNHIDAGIEIVPVKGFADQMSSGVSYFEQFVWDLDKRGESDIDIPVLILGIDR